MSNEFESTEEIVAAFFAQFWKAEADRMGFPLPAFFEASSESEWTASRGSGPPEAG